MEASWSARSFPVLVVTATMCSLPTSPVFSRKWRQRHHTSPSSWRSFSQPQHNVEYVATASPKQQWFVAVTHFVAQVAAVLGDVYRKAAGAGGVAVRFGVAKSGPRWRSLACMADPPIPAPGSLSQPPSSQVLPTGDTDTIPFDPSAPLVEYWRRCNIHYTPAEARQVKQVQVEFKPPSREPSARSSVVSYPADMVFRVAAPMSYMSEHGGDLHVPQRGGRPAPWSVPFRIAPRSVVTAGQGNTLVSVDYSQVNKPPLVFGSTISRTPF